MLLIGITVGLMSGKSAEVSTALIESAKTGVNHAIGMAGVVAMWSGIMRLAEAEGLLDSLTEKLSGLIRFLFPNIPEGHPAGKYIALNFAANVLGLGWASTPAGLSAMEALEQLEEERRISGHSLAVKAGTASREMCTFIVMNVSSLQLIPMTVIAYRSQFGAAIPSAIVLPGILATAVSTLAGLVVVKIMGRRP
jgi:spore maturation protein A